MSRKKKLVDSIIILIAIAGCLHAYYFVQVNGYKQILILIYIGLALIGFIDLVRNWSNRDEIYINYEGDNILFEIALLDDQERIIKKWDIKDKTSLTIGRHDKEETTDIDLTDSEYGALVDYRHAVLNYAAGNWYIEDLYSRNGIRIRKNQDGVCYKVAKDRPCKLSSGDVILIANTKLLFR